MPPAARLASTGGRRQGAGRDPGGASVPSAPGRRRADCQVAAGPAGRAAPRAAAAAPAAAAPIPLRPRSRVIPGGTGHGAAAAVSGANAARAATALIPGRPGRSSALPTVIRR